MIGVCSLLLVVLFSACDDEVDLNKLADEELRYFNLYMDANYPGLEPLESGLYYKEFQEGTGISPDTGDYVLINYICYTIPDEEVIDTYDEEWAIDHGLYSSGVLYGPYKYKHGTELEGLKLGVSLMKEGGISRLIFMSDLGYGGQETSQVGKFESLMYDVELLEVIKDPAAKEQELIDEYIAENPRAYPIKDEETGATLYYISETAGDSIFIKEEMTCEVYYTGQLLDGRVFDSNESSSSGLEVKIGKGSVIDGWEIGLKYFRYGGTGKLLIPHELAYGEDGEETNSGKTAIPPYEALLFDIRVTKTVF